MPASPSTLDLRHAKPSAAPYPSWTVLDDELAVYRDKAGQPCQALKEAHLWRALAEEPVPDEVDETIASGRSQDGTPRR